VRHAARDGTVIAREPGVNAPRMRRIARRGTASTGRVRATNSFIAKENVKHFEKLRDA